MSRRIVAKFGGSSVKDAQAMMQCQSILALNPEIQVVVISATYNTTNQLEQMARLAYAGKMSESLKLLHSNRDRHLLLSNDLCILKAVTHLGNKLEEELESLFISAEAYIQKLLDLSSLTLQQDEIEQNFLSLKDEILAIGELASSLIFFTLLKQSQIRQDICLLDARNLITTNSDFAQALPFVDEVEKQVKMAMALSPGKLFLTQGFIGRDEKGRTTTLGREGSDYTAALLAYALSADLLQIWTDVPGIATLDPRIQPDAAYLATSSYADAALLASLGAKVLFWKTLDPCQKRNIPVWVGSTWGPELAGTLISGQSSCDSLVAVAVMNNVDELRVHWDIPDGKAMVSLVGKISPIEIDKMHKYLQAFGVAFESKIGNGHYHFYVSQEESRSFAIYLHDILFCRSHPEAV